MSDRPSRLSHLSDNADTKLDHALHLASLGLKVFQLHHVVFKSDGSPGCSCGAADCQRQGKHPLRAGWQNEATGSETVIRSWWSDRPDANIGVATGASSNVVVLDVDIGLDLNTGKMKTGDAELDVLEQILGKLPDTWLAQTGSGGKHFYFAWPEGYDLPNTGKLVIGRPVDWPTNEFVDERDSNKLVFHHIQIRGKGGLAVGPGSRHPSGKDYFWDVSPDAITEPAELPTMLLSAIRGHVKSLGPESMAAPVVELKDMGPVSQRARSARRYLAAMPPSVSGEHGHDKLFKAAVALVRGFALPNEEAVEILRSDFNPRCDPSWSDHDLVRKVEQASLHSRQPLGYAMTKMLAAKKAKEEREESDQADYAQYAVEGLVEDLSSLIDVSDEPVRETAPQYKDPAFPEPTSDEELVLSYEQDRDRREALDREDNEDLYSNERIPYRFLRGDEIERMDATLDFIEQVEVTHRTDRSVRRPTNYEDGTFWRYSPRNGIYETIDEKTIAHIATRFANNLVGEGEKVLHCDAKHSRGVVTMAINKLSSRPEHTRFAKAKTGVAFDNGFLEIVTDLQTNKCEFRLLPHSPNHMCRQAMGMKWLGIDREVKGPKMIKFFDGLFSDCTAEEREEKERVLQEFLGAAIVGLAPKFQRYLFMRGEGGNGKSELINMIRHALPENTLAYLPPDQWSRPFQMGQLINKRLNICDDVDDRQLRNEAKIKSVITGGDQHLDRKNKEPINFTPIAAHLMAGNALPANADSSVGFWRRPLVLALTSKINESKNRVRNIGEQVGREERGFIVHWALAGLKRLIENGGVYTEPRSAIEEKASWREETDDAYWFLMNLKDPTWTNLCRADGVKAKDLYNLFVSMSVEAGRLGENDKPRGINGFGHDLMKTAFLTKKEGASANMYRATPALKKERAEREARIRRAQAEIDADVARYGDRSMLDPVEPPNDDELAPPVSHPGTVRTSVRRAAFPETPPPIDPPHEERSSAEHADQPTRSPLASVQLGLEGGAAQDQDASRDLARAGLASSRADGASEVVLSGAPEGSGPDAQGEREAAGSRGASPDDQRAEGTDAAGPETGAPGLEAGGGDPVVEGGAGGESAVDAPEAGSAVDGGQRVAGPRSSLDRRLAADDADLLVPPTNPSPRLADADGGDDPDPLGS